ncbi:MAG: hypothetical protein JWP13_254 [Candidatus Saccharibacteria bacterium]|nr:hypothetical protein [Candidatus Saccharibacteria bacterium]
MSISVSRPTHVAKTFAVGLAVSLMLFVAAGVGSVYAANVTFNSTRNCNANSIINCGAMSVGELQQKYNADNKAKAVYDWYGITQAEMNDLQNVAVAGTAHKNGEVRVNGKVVANNAISAGYNNRAGRTQVNHNGVTFYNSTSQSVFVSDSIDAYVVLNGNGQFRYAILASCGNPMKATNVVPTPTPPTPVQPKPEQPPVVKEKPPVVEEKPPVVEEKPPVVKETPVVQPSVTTPTPEALPAAGPASVAGLFGGASVLAGAGHALYMRRKNRA